MANQRIDIDVGLKIDKTGLNQIKSSLQEIKNLTAQDLMKIGGHTDIQKAEQELKSLKASISQIDGALEKAFNTDLGTLNVSKFNQALKGMNLNQVYKDFSTAGAAGQSAFRNVTSQILTTNMQLKQTHNFLNDMATTMANTVKWGVASSIMNNFTGSVQKAYGYVKSLDTSLNDIRIVTGASADEMERFAVKANNAAKELGKSTTDYTEAALIYYQQGLSDEDVAARAETTLKAANVTGQSGQAVSEQLTAVWNGYKVSAEEAELYIDKLAAVAATTASDLEELSIGMSKVASAADLMGVDIDQLNAQMATIVSVTRQAPESVGTALKTIYARMGDIESGLDADTTLGHYTEEMKAMGVNVLDANGKLRDMGSVIEEIGGKWQSMSREQQIALSQTMAGTRQYNNLLSLFDNWDMYTKALDTSAKSAGTLQKQQDTYMESTQAHLNQLRAASEDLYDSLLDPKGLNPVIDGLTLMTNLFSNFVDSIGGGGGVLLALGSVGTKVFSQQLASGIATFITNMQNAKENANQLRAEMEILNQFQTANLGDVQVEKLVAMKQRVLDLDKSITNEERNIANEYINQQNNLYQQQDDLQNRLTQAKELYTQLTGESVNLTGGDNTANQNLAKQLMAESDELDSYRGNLKATEDAVNSFIRIEKQYADVLKNNNQTTEEGQQVQERYSKALQKAKDEIRNNVESATDLVKSNRLDTQSRNELVAAIESYNKATQNGKKVDLDNISVLNASKNVRETYNKVIHETQQKIKQSAQDLNNHTETMKKNAQATKNLQGDYSNFLSGIDLRAKIQQSVQLVSSFGQLASAFNTIKNIGSIWSNEDLTTGEKLLQTTTNLGFALPMLANSIGQVNKALGIGTSFTEAYNKAKQTSTIVSQTLTKAEMAGISTQKAKQAAQLATLGTEQEAIAVKKILQSVTKGKMTAEQGEIALNQLLSATNVEVGVSSKFAATGVGAFLKALGPIGWAFIAVGAISALIPAFDKLHISAKEAGETVSDSLSELESSTTELENLESSLQGVQDKLDELYSKGELSITDKEDIANLERERIELEAQLALQKEINAEKQKGVVSEVKQALAKGTYDYEGRNKQSVMDAKGNASSFDATSEETKDAWIEGQVARYGENFKDTAEQLADKYYQQYHGEITSQMMEDLDSLQSALDAATATGDNDAADKIKAKIEEIYNSTGMLDDTVLSSIDSVFQGDTAQQSQFHEALQSGDPTGGKWTDEDLAKAGLAESQIEALKVAADAAGISLDTLVNTYKELGNEEIAGTFENNINKIKLGVEGENQSFDSSEAENVVTDLKEQYGVDDDFINRSLEKVDFSKIDYENFAESLKAAMETAMAEQSEEDINSEKEAFKQKTQDIAEANDFDVEAFEDMVKFIGEGSDAIEGLSDDLKENGAEVQEVAKDLTKYDRALEKVIDNSKDWEKALDSDNVQDQAEAIGEMREAYGDLLDLDGESLSQGFLENAENLDLLKQAANGSEEAYNQLREAAMNDIMTRVGIDKTGWDNEFNNLMNEYYQGQNLDDLEVGASLNDEGFLQGLTNMVNAAGLSVADATDLLSSMGIDAEVVTDTVNDTQTEEVTDLIPKVTTVKGTGLNPADGTPTDVEFSGVTYDTVSKPVHTDKQTKASSLKVISANKSSGGGFKYKNSSHGGGSKGKSKGKSGGGKGGGGKKSSEKKVTTKKDRYHDVNVRLKQIDKELEDIGKDQEKYFGKDLIKALNKELDILEKQKKAYKDKLKIAKEEQKELQKSLKADGVKFNSDGTIANYEKALQAQENALNKLIDKYNKLPASKQEKFKEEVLDPAKEEFEKFQENIERYDEVLLDEIPDIEDSLQEIADREIEINVKKLGMEVELRLDLSEAQKDWNEFQREVLDGIDSDDILGNAQADKSLYETLLSNGTLGAETNKISNIMQAIKDIDSTGTSAIYGDNKALAMEDLKAAMDELMGSMTDLNELKKNIDEAYLDMIDKTGEAFDEHAESLEYINGLIEHNINLTELLHGDDAYAEMAKHYQDMENNNLAMLASQRAAADYYKQMMETETDPEAIKKWQALWKEATDNLNATVEASVENLIDKYMNAIDLAFDTMQEKFASLVGDKGSDYYSLEWEFETEQADKYLGSLDKAYELQKLQNKYQKSIDSTSSVKAQRELNKLMDEEMKKLREKDKLTQYDIDRANAKYELRLKEIALEEAQQNKSQMRLRRDSSGNYSYQFVADEQAIADAQQDVADATHSLFQMDEEEAENKAQEALEILQKYNEKWKQIDKDDKEAQALLEQQFKEEMALINADWLAINSNLYESAFMDRALLYDEDIATYQAMSDAEREIFMNQMVPTWNTGVREMMDAMSGPQGLGPICEQLFTDLKAATEDYNTSLGEVETTSGRTFDTTKEQYEANIELAKQLVGEAAALITKAQEELTAVGELKEGVDTLAESYATVYKNATDALTAAKALWEEQQRQAAEEAKKNNPEPGKNPEKDPPKTPDPEPPKTPDPEPVKDSGEPKVGKKVTYESGKYYYTSAGDSPTGTKKRGKKVYITKIKKGAKYPIHISTGSSLGSGDLGWLKEKQLKFDTGGYTGDWAGNDGKTAILHKKELVLNAKDTENILATVNIVRDMQTMINSLNDSIISRTSGMMNSIGSNLDLNTTVGTDLNQQVSIQASFPGVSSRAEIEQAFENLVNMASQHAYNTRR